jgi:hypothetical protein
VKDICWVSGTTADIRLIFLPFALHPEDSVACHGYMLNPCFPLITTLHLLDLHPPKCIYICIFCTFILHGQLIMTHALSNFSEILSSLGHFSFSGRTLLHGVSYLQKMFIICYLLLHHKVYLSTLIRNLNLPASILAMSTCSVLINKQMSGVVIILRNTYITSSCFPFRCFRFCKWHCL